MSYLDDISKRFSSLPTQNTDNTQGRDTATPPSTNVSPPAPTPPNAPNAGNQVAQKIANLVTDFEPVLEVMGIDKKMRAKIFFNLLVKGKMGGLGGLFDNADRRTRMEKFWDGMTQGLPFIIAVYGLFILTFLLRKWGVI